MGRREERAAVQSSWTIFEPREGRTPFSKKDLEDAAERARAEAHERARMKPPTIAIDQSLRGVFTLEGSEYKTPEHIIACEPSAMLIRTLIARGAQ